MDEEAKELPRSNAIREKSGVVWWERRRRVGLTSMEINRVVGFDGHVTKPPQPQVWLTVAYI